MSRIGTQYEGGGERLSDEDCEATRTAAEIEYQIVGPDEFDVGAGRISMDSPVGRALLGRSEGDEVSVRRPRGETVFEILEVRPIQGVEISILGDSKPGRIHAVSVVARWSLSYPDREDASGLTMIVLQRRGDGWSIIHDASM